MESGALLESHPPPPPSAAAATDYLMHCFPYKSLIVNYLFILNFKTLLIYKLFISTV